MKENEALEYLKKTNRQNDMLGILPGSDIWKTLIKALEEVQRYRDTTLSPEQVRTLQNHFVDVSLRLGEYMAIGTVEELETASKYLRLVKMCGTVGKVIEECAEYEEIGTPEECRAAVEQQIPKRPTLCKSDEQTTRYTADYRCPKCNGMFTGTGIANYCYHCGQRLDWEE